MNMRGSPGIKHAREWGSISAPILCLLEDLEPAAEGDANVPPSGAAESRENACSGTVLEGGYASRGGLDGCTVTTEVFFFLLTHQTARNRVQILPDPFI